MIISGPQARLQHLLRRPTAAAGTTYTVTVPSGAEIVNTKWITIPLTSVNSGDNVRVYGVNASGTITARIVRDVTIVATTTAQ